MATLPVPIEELWSLPGREARKIVDLDAIAANTTLLKASLSAGTKLMAVVKANAYGHGDVQVARAALAAGADAFAVATLEEGLRMRRAGIAAPILCLGPLTTSELSTARQHGLQATIGSSESLQALSQLDMASDGHRLEVQIEINTGMNRYGIQPLDVLSAFATIAQQRDVVVAGTFTHFAKSDEIPEAPLQRQIEMFQIVLDKLRQSGFDPGLLHASNSGGILRGRNFDFDMVRAGIALYGVPPSADIPLLPGMQSAMTIRCRSQRVSTIEAGAEIGYGGTWSAPHTCQIALLPVGYADGLSRSLSNVGQFLSNGTAHAIVGRVSMDQCVVAAPAGISIGSRQEFRLLGDSESAKVSAVDLAEQSGTIPYEVLTSFGLRLRGYYQAGNYIVAHDNTINDRH